MANQLQRKGTSLIEITQEEAQKAITPAGTAAQGGTPAQAAASATPNGKAPVLAEAVDKTLQREQRLTPKGPSAEQQGAAQQAQAKADRLRQLGSLGSRVDSLLEQRLQQQAATGPVSQSIDDSKLALEFPNDPTKQAQVRDALAAYLAAPAEGKEAALAALSTAAGTLVDPNRLLKSAAATVQGAVQAPPSQPVTMAEVGWGDLDPQQVATDLGLSVDQVNALTPEQLSGAVAEVQAREFQQQRALAAELATASPQRKAQIWAELRAGQMVGVNATELAVDQLKGELVSDAEVEFNGQPYKLNDLLKSDVVSKEILKAAQDPKYLEEFAAKHPQLAEWVRSNVEALSELSKTQAAEATALGAVQTQLGAATEKFDDKLLEVLGVSVPEFATAEQVAQITEQLQNSSVAQAVLADGTLSGVFTANPALVQQLAGETKEQILERKKLTDSIGQDATLTALLGYDPATGLFTGDVATAKELQGLYNGLGPAVKGDPILLQAVQAGDIDKDTLKHLARYPESAPQMLANYDAIQKRSKLLDRMVQDKDVAGLTKTLFGTTDLGTFNKSYKDALKIANNPRNYPANAVVKARDLVAKLKRFGDADSDGDIDANDIKRMLMSPSLAADRMGTAAPAKTALNRNYVDPLTAAQQYLAGIPGIEGEITTSINTELSPAQAEAKAKSAPKKDTYYYDPSTGKNVKNPTQAEIDSMRAKERELELSFKEKDRAEIDALLKTFSPSGTPIDVNTGANNINKLRALYNKYRYATNTRTSPSVLKAKEMLDRLAATSTQVTPGRNNTGITSAPGITGSPLVF